ncbi:hypothetical protein Zmor_026853 [Zophobas morio]|uniref:Uncharacterized protein n=1 Tax=Zophobas morio TaxID=2755281 RepID=A0AA38M5X7_9CUCU|nr:hypothetical protein Zmor_026853 [Zophobas morio]
MSHPHSSRQKSIASGMVDILSYCALLPYSQFLNSAPEDATYETTFSWVNSCIGDKTVPPMAVPMGFDAQGHPIYIERAHFNNELTPAHVVPARRVAYVPHNGKEHIVENYQLLCINLKWVPAQGGQVPPGAVQTGHNKDGSPLYVGRVCHGGAWIVGKIHPKFSVCCFPCHGQELTADKYEALVCHM